MKALSTRLSVVALEDRTVPSTVAYGDFNHDGRLDMAAITAPRTITVSLANANGGYTVAATLTTPQNRPVQSIQVVDVNGDGNLDVYATSQVGNKTYLHTWLGEGNGAFGSRHTQEAWWSGGSNWV